MDSDAAIRPGASPVRAPDRDLHLSPMSRSTNGRPEPEVIVQYLDGFAYNKVKMEEAFLPGGFLAEKVAQKPHTPAKDPNVKKEDVDLITHEFEIPRTKAEKVLQQHGGDINKALRSLVGLST